LLSKASLNITEIIEAEVTTIKGSETSTQHIDEELY